MTQISSYYASVGVRVDNSALKNVDSFLAAIKKQLKSFQETVSKSHSLKVKMMLDNQGLTRKFREVVKSLGDRNSVRVKTSLDTSGLANTLKAFSAKSSIRISDFKVNRGALNRALNTQPVQQQQSLKGSLTSVTLNNFKVNRGALNKAIKDITIGSILLKSFSVDKKAIQNAVNNALGGNAGQGGRTSLRLGARLSQDSITAMREQVRQGLSNITIRPGVNARVSASQRTSGGGSSSSGSGKGGWSPFSHSFGPKGINPFVFGGLAGGMLRFGAFAIPGVAGAWGANAIANQGAMLENQRLMMSTAAGDPETAKRNMEVSDQIAERLGRKTSTIAPFYAQMYAGARGTELEAKLPKGFESFMEYASVMGMGDEQLKGSIRAISQAVSKGRIQSEEWRQQLSEHGMPEAMNILADVAAGGDRTKLEKMMEQGQVDVYKYLPLFFEEVGKRAQATLPMFYESIQYQRGMASRSQENFMVEFYKSGGEAGIASWFRTWDHVMKKSTENASILGDGFYRLSNALSFVVLAGSELTDWLKGLADDKNIWNEWLGDLKDNKWTSIVSSNFDRLKGVLDPFFDTAEKYNIGLTEILNGMGYFSEQLLTLAEMISHVIVLDFEGAKNAMERQNMRRKARDEAYSQVKQNPEMTAEDVKSLEKTLYEKYIQESKTNPPTLVSGVETAAKIAGGTVGAVVGARVGGGWKSGAAGAAVGSSGVDWFFNIFRKREAEWYERERKRVEDGVLYSPPENKPPEQPSESGSIISRMYSSPFGGTAFSTPQSAKMDLNITIKSDGLTPEAESGIVEGITKLWDNWWNDKGTNSLSGTPQPVN